MRTLSARLTAAFCFFALTALLIAQDDNNEQQLPVFNQHVLNLAASYPSDGTHDYWWPRSGEGNYDGVTQDLYLQGECVLKGEENKRTFCCGLTLEVFLRAYNDWLAAVPEGTEPPITAEDWDTFQKKWFVEKLNGPGPSAALEEFNIGREIPAVEAMPGDFVQIWRTPKENGKVSGHSVVFLEWVKNDEDAIIGMKYWSTQPATSGIRQNVEYFGPLGGISTENTYFARVELGAQQAGHSAEK